MPKSTTYLKDLPKRSGNAICYITGIGKNSLYHIFQKHYRGHELPDNVAKAIKFIKLAFLDLDLETLKESLGTGYVNKLCDESGLKRDTIIDVMNGHHESALVIMAAVKLINAEAKRMEDSFTLPK